MRIFSKWLNSSEEEILVTAYEINPYSEFQIPEITMKITGKNDYRQITTDESDWVWENVYALVDEDLMTLRPINGMDSLNKFPSGGYISLTTKGRKRALSIKCLP